MAMESRTIEIMNQDRHVASVREDGLCTVLLPQFMPFNLWLFEADDLDTREKNLNRFHFWCATRVLTLKRESAKDYLLSHGI